ncbi:MAG: anhydro-N-acetylmuramic acid kinase [Bacteroidia bacterium]
MKKYTVIGLMSGTSLDGLDIACCEFRMIKNKWTWHIVKAETVTYTRSMKNRLEQAPNEPAAKLLQMHHWFGAWQGEQVKKFIEKHILKPDLVCAHGHTVFHQPQNGLTLQIGSGAGLAAACCIETVTDFRSLDVALGGQGAPLVPIGDELLFTDYDYCLNLGGFANISYSGKGSRLAFDICPVNIILNKLSREAGKPYDKNGEMARKGVVSHSLLKKLNNLSYYRIKGPKSLGKEWVDQQVSPLLEASEESIPNKLATCVEHVAMLIARELKRKKAKILVTGGGAWNDYLMERIRYHSESSIPLPDNSLIAFKEALIFAFLGLLRYRNEVNTLCSVTGASRDSSGGSIWSGRKGKKIKNPR